MAFFQLALKANRLERVRVTYEDEKLKSIQVSKGDKIHYTFFQKLRLKKIMLKMKIKAWLDQITSCPENSWFHKKAVLLRTDGTFENFILKSLLGFLGGMFLTYIFFMFFIFQLNFTLSSATMLCSFLGIILTLGLAFSHRIRCMVFLLLPQFFSKRGRQALMAYAFILVLTGPAKNTLHNTGVLSESLACGQEQLKETVKSIVDLMKQPFYALKNAIARVIRIIKIVVKRIKETLLAIKRIVLSILRVFKAAYEWLGSIINICNKKFGTPFERCQKVFEGAVTDCKASLGPLFGGICNLVYIVELVCLVVKPLDLICMLVSFVTDAIVGTIRRKVKRFTKHMKSMFYVKVNFSHSFHFETNHSKNLEEVSTGIVTEIKSRTDKFLTVFDWMSFVTSFFFMFMLLRVIYYRHKWLTNDRFDNRYLTDDLRKIDLRRVRMKKETVLPLNPRERNKYVSLSSVTLIKSERIKLMRSAIFLSLTTLKLCIHMIADYSLYWVLSTIRYHGRFETKVEVPNSVGIFVSGSGFLADLYRSIVRAFMPYGSEMDIDSIPCLPDPVPPDFDRYMQIISLIALCWIMAIFEPYGLRLRQIVMSYYHPDRAKQRAVWLYNHIIRSRGSFLKFARRQLRRRFGMSGKKDDIEKVTLKERLVAVFPLLRKLCPDDKRKCLLCGVPERENQPPHVKCPTPDCVGLFCATCFLDLQNLCTICLAPIDYGDLSDMSEEKDSSDEPSVAVKDKRSKAMLDADEVRKRKEGEEEEDEAGSETTRMTDDIAEQDQSSSNYNYSYQDESPEEIDVVQQRIPHKDIEAQKMRDDVTIQIFNEPVTEYDTSSSDDRMPCFAVRTKRRLRSKLKGKLAISPVVNREDSSTSIADTESLPTEEIDEEEVIHIEVEDDSNESTLLQDNQNKKRKNGRVKKIITALSKASWVSRKTNEKSTFEGLQPKGPSFMSKVINMFRIKHQSLPEQTYTRTRIPEDETAAITMEPCSSPSSLSSYNDNQETNMLLNQTNLEPLTNTERLTKRKMRQVKHAEDSDEELDTKTYNFHRGQYEESMAVACKCTGKNIADNRQWHPHEKKFNTQKLPRYLEPIIKDTKYVEVNETILHSSSEKHLKDNANKLMDGKVSSASRRKRDTWNITDNYENPDTRLHPLKPVHGVNLDEGAYTLHMSTIEEDSSEVCKSESKKDDKLTSLNGTEEYANVTGLSSIASESKLDIEGWCSGSTDDDQIRRVSRKLKMFPKDSKRKRKNVEKRLQDVTLSQEMNYFSVTPEKRTEKILNIPLQERTRKKKKGTKIFSGDDEVQFEDLPRDEVTNSFDDENVNETAVSWIRQQRLLQKTDKINVPEEIERTRNEFSVTEAVTDTDENVNFTSDTSPIYLMKKDIDSNENSQRHKEYYYSESENNSYHKDEYLNKLILTDEKLSMKEEAMDKVKRGKHNKQIGRVSEEKFIKCTSYERDKFQEGPEINRCLKQLQDEGRRHFNSEEESEEVVLKLRPVIYHDSIADHSVHQCHDICHEHICQEVGDNYEYQGRMHVDEETRMKGNEYFKQYEAWNKFYNERKNRYRYHDEATGCYPQRNYNREIFTRNSARIENFVPATTISRYPRCYPNLPNYSEETDPYCGISSTSPEYVVQRDSRFDIAAQVQFQKDPRKLERIDYRREYSTPMLKGLYPEVILNLNEQDRIQLIRKKEATGQKYDATQIGTKLLDGPRTRDQTNVNKRLAYRKMPIAEDITQKHRRNLLFREETEEPREAETLIKESRREDSIEELKQLATPKARKRKRSGIVSKITSGIASIFKSNKKTSNRSTDECSFDPLHRIDEAGQNRKIDSEPWNEMFVYDYCQRKNQFDESTTADDNDSTR